MSDDLEQQASDVVFKLWDGDNDPLPRFKTESGEPHFLLIARDPLAPGLTRLWAALRARDPNAVQDIINKLVLTSMGLPIAPEKDPAHIISARQVANDMDVWRYGQQPRPVDRRSIKIAGVGDYPPQEAGVKAGSFASIDPKITAGEGAAGMERFQRPSYVPYECAFCGTGPCSRASSWLGCLDRVLAMSRAAIEKAVNG